MLIYDTLINNLLTYLLVKKKKKQQVSNNQELVQSEPNYSNELGADGIVT